MNLALPAHWPFALAARWAASPEAGRAARLQAADPDDYGGEVRRRAAVATCLADFERTAAAEDLRGRQLPAAELEAQRKPQPQLPAAPRGYSYRPCRKCVRGVVRPGGQRCSCAVVLGGQPGFELCAGPGAAPLLMPEGQA